MRPAVFAGIVALSLTGAATAESDVEALMLDEIWERMEAPDKETMRAQFDMVPKLQRGALVRQMYLASSFEDESFVASVGEVFGTALTTANGCLMPSAACRELRSGSLTRLSERTPGPAMFALGVALTHSDFSNCDPERIGVVDSVVLTTGEEHFVLMSENNEEASACFIRKVGT